MAIKSEFKLEMSWDDFFFIVSNRSQLYLKIHKDVNVSEDLLCDKSRLLFQMGMNS